MRDCHAADAAEPPSHWGRYFAAMLLSLLGC
jgi:hypothetical protein